MNWEAIGAIGEIVGAIAVVGSLIYLATQIHVSNLAAKQATMQEVMNELTTFLGRINSNRETALTWSNGLENMEELEKGELVQFTALCLEVTII